MRIGHWKLTKLLGEGTYGRVFEGHHATLGPDVKVCVKQEKTGQEPYKTMFREEAILLAKLRHHSVPAFMDYIESDDPRVGQLLVLSFIPGVPLDKLLKEGPIDDEHVCWILDRILGALSYLHGRHNLVHCDLKPGNVIIDVDYHQGTVVDFGMAAYRPDGKTLPKGGTPGFLPPEFALGYPPIPVSDFYSIGKIGIELAGGDVKKGECPDDMHPLLKELLGNLIRRDPMQRARWDGMEPDAMTTADDLRDRIGALRVDAFGSDECSEVFKRRGDG